jgi:hypothetical protein
MRPAPHTTPAAPPAPAVAARARAGAQAGAALPPAVGSATTRHGRGADVAWALALAGVFAVLVGAGVVRVLRARE